MNGNRGFLLGWSKGELMWTLSSCYSDNETLCSSWGTTISSLAGLISKGPCAILWTVISLANLYYHKVQWTMNLYYVKPLIFKLSFLLQCSLICYSTYWYSAHSHPEPAFDRIMSKFSHLWMLFTVDFC